MRKLLLLLVCALVSIGTRASISVWQTSTNGVDGYGIYNWDNPGDIAAFLNGDYQGTVYNENDADADWVTNLLPLVKTAETVKLGGNADQPKEPIGTADLQALEKLTNVKYLRMDNCFPAEGTDFSKIKIGSSALIDATMPIGLTKEQIEQANNALKATATGLKTTSGITGTVTTTTTHQYWYELNGQTLEYTGADAAEGATITLTDYDVEVPLTAAAGYPVIKYTNSKNNNKSESATANDVISGGKIIPEYVPVALTEIDKPSFSYNGKPYPFNWGVDANGVTTQDIWDWGGTPNPIPSGTQLDVEHNYSYTYKFRRTDWGATDEDTYTYDGEPLIDPVDGHKYALIPNLQSETHRYQFDITTSEYKYTYTDLNGATQNYPAEGVLSSPDDDMKYTLQYTGEVGPLTMTTEVTKELTVDGSTIYVNEAGTLSDADYMFTNAQNTNFKSSKNITVLGEVNNTDLDYLKADNFASAKLIDVSETTKASGATYGTLTSAATDAALFLPKAVTKDELITLEEPNFGSRTCAYVEKEDEEGNRVMHVYANSGSVANLAPIVDNKTGIYFLKHYASDGDSFAGANNTEGNEAFRLGLGDLHAISMDFSNYHASMMPDFTHLTSDTHFLTVGQNTNQTVTTYDFTADVAASNYKYGPDVWVVSTYKSGDNVSKAYQGKSLEAIGETALITYIRVEDKMEQAAPFLSDDQQNASRVIFVTKDGVSMTESDIECISYMNCNKLDFLDANVSDANLLALDNDNVKYIALPDNSAAITATSPDDFSFSKCASLLSVASYNTTTNTYRVHSTKNLDENGDQIESVYVVTSLIRPKPEKRSTGNMANGLDKVEFTGYFNNLDIATPVNTTNCGLHDAGSITVADFTNAVFPDNHDMNFNAAGWGKLTSINLPTSDQMTVIPANCLNNNSNLTYLCVPYNYEYIEDGAFWLTGLGHITTTDAAGAEVDNGPHTWTISANVKCLGTERENYNGEVVNTVFPQNVGVEDIYCLAVRVPKCYANVFPQNASYGWGGWDSKQPYCRDRYYNGGKQSEAWAVLHYPSLETFNTSAGDKEDSYDDMKKLYTDVNKVYTKKEQTGAVDANGVPIAWPTQSQGNRSYNQASLGLTWNEWAGGTGDDVPYGGTVNQRLEVGQPYSLSSAPATVTGAAGDYPFTNYMGWHQIVLSLATYFEPDEKIVAEKIVREYEDAGYFTFCIPYNMTYKQVVEMLGVPKSTDKVVNKLNGTEVTSDIMPEIRQLSSVTRKKGSNGENNIVMLRLTPNLFGAPTEGYTGYLQITYNENSETHQLVSAEPYNASSNIDDRLSLIGGRPYVIKAYKRVQYDESGKDLYKISGQNIAKSILTRYADQFGIENSIVQNTTYESYLSYEQLGNGTDLTLRFAKPYENHKVQALRDGENSAYLTYDVNENGETVKKKYYYTMIGQFWDQPLPLYSIYMAKGNWYRYTDESKGYTWDRYKCVIMATQELVKDNSDKHYGGGYRDNSSTGSVYPTPVSGDLLTQDMVIKFLDGRDDDDFDGNGTSAKYIFSFDDDGIVEFGEDGNQLTAIKQLDGEDMTIGTGNGKVYNMSGQYVGNTLNGLSKGLYIVNGKKVIVK